MRTVVGVLRGGPSSEYEISLQSGANVLEALDTEKYEPRDLFISRDGVWHLRGVEVPAERALRGVDVAFNVIHGGFGEDGRVQRILESFSVPYTGADALASALASNKQHTKDIVARAGVRVAHGLVVEPSSDLEAQAFDIFRSFPHPAVVKPVAGGSSVATTFVENYHALEHGLAEAFKVGPKALIEEFIKGREATVGVVEGFRGQQAYALLPVEIIPPKKHKIFSYDAKYSGETIENCPGNFSEKEKNELERLAKLVHEEMGLSHYSRSDFIVAKRGIYFLEVNSAAGIGMTKESLFPKALAAVGSKVSEFVDHIIELALKRNS
jgi:D-alanine-D-alanine ligase